MLEKVRALLNKGVTREIYFGYIAYFLPEMDPRYQMIQRAYDSTEKACSEEQRATGERYFDHVSAVGIIQVAYLMVKKHTVLTAGITHDLTEDHRKDWPISRIRLEFGEEVALLQDYASKLPKENFSSEAERLKAYHGRFPFAPRDFWLFKLPDRLHNLLTMWNFSPEKIAFKIAETERYYLPYAEEHCILIHELKEVIEELKKSKPS
ncbi:MAG: hypothetical protein A3D46_03200 [Candidatus Nealsonbacteria bacterium RIFCSPHIGHO2_02_FULL_43_13]|uniref:HD domain-containing protein n=1 Tax=Candidatus Nealsonbacteria bacterium RIFCSPHIGHO2_02_FULL_43_13 TaxID=1801668 RepID=A0A1G2E9U4_9BACT|nr:MAG: hypothetical protein A3D46_03200 [Candidatus Nealsonbacteria bacterium RIFCSPHIGHO2_02_FULL_43_13]